MQYEELQPNEVWGLDTSETLISDVFKAKGGYTNYAIGKWNLGHYTPEMLPTARGFDQYIGFLSGQNYYWSKRYPVDSDYIDFIYSDSTCYAPYDGSDLETYSTFLYRDKAVKVINNHDYSQSPMFLYLAMQAVHDPFNDYSEEFSDGIPSSYLDSQTYEFIKTNIPGLNRQQYAMALKLLDNAVESIHAALEQQGQLDNTYIIFASDNGGCYQAGGRNGDLRGSKGSLFEGGVKVDSFVYSSSSVLVPESARGSSYDGIMHVSDWFPTLLDLAGLAADFQPASGFELDGYSQAAAIVNNNNNGDNPREFLLYNMYYNVDKEDFNTNENAPV